MNKQLTPFSNIYNHFNHQPKKKRNDILKSTKCLIVSSSNYSDYTQQYLKTIHVNTFKQPEIDKYPVLQNHNLISLTAKTFDFSQRSQQRYQCFSPSQTKHQRYPTLPTSPLLLTEPKLKKKRRVILSEPDLKLKLNPKKHLLRDILFNEPNYLNMIYDESLIFQKKALYISYMKKIIEELKYKKYSNATTELARSFNNDSVILKYESMTLEFINLTNKGQRPIIFKLPFAYTPLFYYKEYENIKYLLLSVISFNESFEEINFNEEDIYNFLKTSSNANINTNSNKTPSKISTPINDWNWTRFQTNCAEDQDNSLFKKKDQYLSPRIVIKSNEKSNKPLNIFSQYYNIIQQVWITPKYKYLMQIKMPTITLQLPSNNKEIKKTVDPELVLFLLMNNLAQWDFYLTNYLVSIKAFRWIMKQTLTKSIGVNGKTNDYLKDKTSEELMKEISIRTIKGFEYINLTKSRIKTPCEEDNVYQFYQTDRKMKNNFIIFHNYSVSICSKSIKSNKEFQFDFDFNQMKKLNAVSHFQSLDSFINKITVLNANTEKIALRYEIFNDLNVESLSKDEIMSNCFSDYQSKDKDKNKEKELKISITYPYLEKIHYATQLSDETNSIITDTNDKVHKVLLPEVLDELCQKDINQWAEILGNVRNDSRRKTVAFNINNENKRDSVIKKKSSKRLLFRDTLVIGNLTTRNQPLNLSIKKSKTLIYKTLKSS